jgi:hypothetical protein
MRIEIAARLRPFLSRPGVPILLPGTNLVVTAYPAEVELLDLEGNCLRVFPLTLPGGTLTFSVEQDLERGCITGWGSTTQRHAFRWRLWRAADGEVHLSQRGADFTTRPRWLPPATGRLSLGAHRRLDWDLVVRRAHLSEWLPVLWRLGRLAPLAEREIVGESLLGELQQAIERARGEAIEPLLRALLSTGFYGLMVPSAVDQLRLGFAPPLPAEVAASSLLPALAGSLQDLFFREVSPGLLDLLPLLPPSAVCGRLTEIPCSLGILHLEWTKRFVRRVALHCHKTGEIQMRFPREVVSFRLRRTKKDPGYRLDAGKPFAVYEGDSLWLDRFLA